jgi:hypothetical protein
MRAEVDGIVRKYDPKALIPSHYFLDGLTTDVSGLESADGWVNDQEKVHDADVRRLNTADLTLNAAELKGSRHRVYYFRNHFEKKQTWADEVRFGERVAWSISLSGSNWI